MKFVVSLAHQYRNRGLGEDDLISEGNIGMMYAAQKFDGSKGVRLLSLRLLTSVKLWKRLSKSKQHSINFLRTRQVDLNRSVHMLSLLTKPVPVGSNNNFTLQHILENENTKHADEHLNQEILSNEIQKGLDVLDEREKRVITYIYGLTGAHYTNGRDCGGYGIKTRTCTPDS